MEAEAMIEGKTLEELKDLLKEIKQSMTVDRSFTMEIQYWTKISKRIEI
jgi:hypothetical protein